MNKQAIALALRAAAENLERAKQLVKGLPASLVDDDSALALWLDAPKVVNALYNVAGSLDPEGTADEWGGMVPPAEADEVVDLAEVDALARRATSC